MVELLNAVMREGTGKSARLAGFVGGKTGTTQDNRDAWFIGFTPEMIVGVWVGNDDNAPTKNVTGGDLPASIWHDFMMQAGRNRPTSGQSVAMDRSRRSTNTKSGFGATPNDMPTLRGSAIVIDTATLELSGRTIRLLGVEGTSSSRAIREFDRVLRRSDIECQPSTEPDIYRCSLQGKDLSGLVLFNGGGRAGPDATSDLLAAEEQARSARVGIWRR
jgi:membrane peptidoglycan carboxypeptidase